jgi:uncharacterized DUF497 family protein
MSYFFSVKSFGWSEEKNEKLLLERGLSFEQVVLAIEEGGLLDVLEHPNQEKYRGQRLMVVRIGNYAVLVPFVEDTERVFLKTIIPSRKATKAYLTRGGSDDD